jgi:hypothetical protein
MPALHAAMWIVGAFVLIGTMYVWIIRSNRSQHRTLEGRRQDFAESARAEGDGYE